MNRVTLARLLAIAAATASISVITIGGALTPRYSHVSNFISELGATGMPWGEAVSLAGFIPVGVLIALFLFVALPVAQVSGTSRVGYFLLFSQSVAYISAGLAPCDMGCPTEGSISQGLHNLFGLVTYLLAAVGIVMLSMAPKLTTLARAGFIVGGFVWLAAFFLMVEPDLAHLRGVFQRVAEVVLWATVFFVAFRMLDEDAGRKTLAGGPSRSRSGGIPNIHLNK